MNKKIVFFIVSLMVLSSLAGISFVSNPAHASPPQTGDKALTLHL
ncbi:MAG: hypothetical protein QXU18_08250 [Thermoplasmatales archaeon]